MQVATPSIRTPIVMSRLQSARPDLSGPVHAMAMIPTAWGTCGVVWKNREDESAEGFSMRPDQALLCRICTPGLTAVGLREYFRGVYPDCMEVLCNAGGVFHPETVPDWFSEIRTYLQSYYSAALRHWSVPQFSDNWVFWQPRLDWDQLTPFQRRVLQVVANIPSGGKLTYGEVAARIG